MTTLHGKEINEGYKVWHIRVGWEFVRSIDEDSNFPITLGCNAYTETGRLYKSDLNPSIYWEEMILTPKPEPVYEWQWVYWDGDKYETSIWHKSYDSLMAWLHNGLKVRPPIRIEESKREVKP